MGNAATKPSSEDEATNYRRIILLIVGVGTEVLLHLFYSLVPKNTVKDYFASKKSEIDEGKRKKVYDKDQYAKLTCRDPNPDDFEIFLLIKLLIHFKLSPENLDSLQTISNEIAGHRQRAELNMQEFKSRCVTVESAIYNIARSVSEYEAQITKEKIEKLKENLLDVSDAEQMITNKVLQLDQHQEEMAVTHENIQSLQDEVSESQHPALRQQTLQVLQQDLIAYYRKCFSRLTISPLIDEDEYAADFLEIYVKPILAISSHRCPKGQSQSILVKSCHDIFVKDSKQCQNIYISSPAGCGKTSLARWLARTWCHAHQPIVEDNKWFDAEDVDEMRKFILVFIVFLRDEHEQECDVDIMIKNQLLSKLANSSTYTEGGVKFVQEILGNVKCIIILDGLDEWSHPPKSMCTFKNYTIPHSRARPLCTTLTTSRPWKLDVVGHKPGEIDQKLELNGLNEDLFKRLINNVVTTMNTVHGKKMQVDDFKLVLRIKKLSDLSKIPVVLMHLLTVWFDKEQLGESQCEIYSNMIELLLKRYCDRTEDVSVMEDIKEDDCKRNRHIPMCLQNNMYCKVHMELLSKLATLAYNTLFTDYEETSLVFDRSMAKKYLTDPEIEMSLAAGILTQEKVLGKMSIRQSHISFLHKTFQEYFAALSVALNQGMAAEVEEKIRRVCCSIEKILEMSQIFMFVSGMCPEVMEHLHEHLRQTVSEDSRTQRYRASCELGAQSDEGHILWQVQYCMEEQLGECWLNGHKRVTHLPVSDFFVGCPRPWSAELKSLTVHNPVCSLYVLGDAYHSEEIEEILNYVTVFKSIQKLLLWGVSDTFVVQLVSQHRQSLSASPKTWKHLKCVTLASVKMSGDILCSLVDSILQLPKSVKVRLEKCRICQTTRNWKANILSHERLIVDAAVDSECNVELLQFNTIYD